MKAEIIQGVLLAVDGKILTIYTTTHTPEGENLDFPYEGFDINEECFKTLSTKEARYTVIDGVVKEVV